MLEQWGRHVRVMTVEATTPVVDLNDLVAVVAVRLLPAQMHRVLTTNLVQVVQGERWISLVRAWFMAAVAAAVVLVLRTEPQLLVLAVLVVAVLAEEF